MYEVLYLKYLLYVCTLLYTVRLVDVYSIYRKLFCLLLWSKVVGFVFHGWLCHIHKRGFLGMLVFWKYIYIGYSICVNMCQCIWIITYVYVLSKVFQEMCESVCQVGECVCGLCLLWTRMMSIFDMICDNIWDVWKRVL